MDDFVVWGHSAAELRWVREQVREFLAREMKLELKPNTSLNRTVFGMDFLGYRLFPDTMRLARRSKVRFARKFRRYEAAHERGDWSDLKLQQRVQALLAFLLPADSWAFRRQVIEYFGVAARRLEPRESGRQLEQQRQQLPDREPQQQQPGQQQQQQQRVPLRPRRSSTRTPEGVRTDPAAILSPADVLPGRRPRSIPPGASRLRNSSDRSGRECAMRIGARTFLSAWAVWEGAPTFLSASGAGLGNPAYKRRADGVGRLPSAGGGWQTRMSALQRVGADENSDPSRAGVCAPTSAGGFANQRTMIYEDNDS
jgi:hypothetical protein